MGSEQEGAYKPAWNRKEEGVTKKGPGSAEAPRMWKTLPGGVSAGGRYEMEAPRGLLEMKDWGLGGSEVSVDWSEVARP